MTTQTDFTLERTKEIREIVEDMFEGIPKSKQLNYTGHLNDILLFIGASERAIKGEKVNEN